MCHEEKTPQGNTGSDLMVWMAAIAKVSEMGPEWPEGLERLGAKGAGWEGAQERLGWARSLGAT